ncbi:MAG: glutamine-hydrolyzing carbamoyl-phosphate synthase small subunit [Rickettsiales bacterium]
MSKTETIPTHANACLLLADGTVFFGNHVGTDSITTGEICFNTAMTGYQEILTDPSYAGQIITFTFPHIGNVGCNDEDIEANAPHCHGLVLRERPTLPSNFRSAISLDEWLAKNNMAGIYGVDTRALTRHIRKAGAQNVAIFSFDNDFDARRDAAQKALDDCPSMKGLDLAKKVTTSAPQEWDETLWQLSPQQRTKPLDHCHIVAIDFGAKHNILRNLAERGCKITTVPASSSAEDILALNPDGIFLSNGPGDPAATGTYAIPMIKQLIDTDLPIFGICLGHQLLGIALGGTTEKMEQGHRGANHPVKNLETGRVEITSQNHGFAVSSDGLPKDVEVTHISLFDGTVQGLRHTIKPIFGVQGHPEASPGPHDSAYLFDAFVDAMKSKASGDVKKVKTHA